MSPPDDSLSEVTAAFEVERPRLVALAGRILADRHEAQDVVQTAWLRLTASEERVRGVQDLPAWLTTTTTRLCLDRLRARRAVPTAEIGADGEAGVDDDRARGEDPQEEVELAETVGVALHVVLDRLTPRERVAFVLHDTLGYPFPLVAQVLDVTGASARQLASRARRKVRPDGVAGGAAGGADSGPEDGPRADWEVVDTFLAAARTGDLAALLSLLAPDALVTGDAAAVAQGTPQRIEGREAVAAMFDGAASSALPTLLDGRPGAAWSLRGELKVAFDFTVEDGRVTRIDFRADPEVLARLTRRARSR